MYAIGGQQRHDTDPVDLAAVDVYDPEHDVWTAVAPLPAPASTSRPRPSCTAARS
jgi:hypothetical protein